MIPAITGIDHIHVSVANWADGEQWYEQVLGYKRVDALMPWAVENGPLTIESPDGSVHLALFESDNPKPITAIAFNATAAEIVAWISHLEDQGLNIRIADHKLAWSLYFYDPWENMYEITTYEYDEASKHLKPKRF